MKKIVLSLFFILLFLSPGYSADFDSYVYWVIPGTKKTIQWDTPIEGADGYEFKIWRMETSQVVYQTKIISNQITITWKTPGIYYPYVRSYKGPIATRVYTEWINALDPTVAVVNGKSKAWAIYVPMR
jgi:hypothetical protein